MLKKSLICLFLVFTVLMLSYTGYGKNNGPNKEASVIDEIKASGKIVIGTSADYPPYEFHLLNDKEEEIVGLDIDIAKAIAHSFGVKLVVKDMIFSKLLQALNNNEVNLVIAGLTPTEKRKKLADFSDIYYQALQNMLIRAKDVDIIKSLQDLRGKKVGTQRDTIQGDMIRTRVVGAYFLERETIQELIDDLKNGDVDAVILEKPVAESYVLRNKELMNIECETDEGLLGSAIAVKKGQNDLLKAINTILAKLKKEKKITEFAEDAKILMSK